MTPGRSPPAPDIIFVKVQEALAQGGCPICRIGHDSGRRFLWGFLYERVNDPYSREEVLASRGFCARHAWALGEFHDALGVAIVYRHLLQQLGRDIRRGSNPPPPGRRRGVADLAVRLRAALRPTRECPLCAHLRQAENSALHALVKRVDQPEVRERLSGPSALCLPHFLAGLPLADNPAAASRLIDAELAALAAATHDLDEFIRKHDYRFSAEGLTPGQAVSWARAIELLVGRDPLEGRGGWSPWR